MDTEFGIVPYPKYDTAQPEYLPNTAGVFLSVVTVPSTNTDIENTGLFLEAFAYDGSRSVVPAFYENILKGKVARDDESVDMLEYIFGNIHYDTGNLFDLGGFVGHLTGMSGREDTNVASMLERNIPALERAIERLLENMNGE
jgi:hypothetical protein